MKEKLEIKLDQIFEYIMNKPVETITKDDYEVLASGLRDLRFQEEQRKQSDRLDRIMANTATTFPSLGEVAK